MTAGSRGVRDSGALRYSVAVLLALSVQSIRLATPAPVPAILFVPILLVTARWCGRGPGLLATGLCAIEAVQFTGAAAFTGGIGFWLGVAALVATGVRVSTICERLKRARWGYASKDAASLREAYSELAAIYANVPVILLVVDEQLRVEKVNDLARQFAGREMDEMLGLVPGEAMGCASTLLHPDGCGHGPTCSTCPVRSALSNTLEGGTHYQGVEGWLPFTVDGRQEQRCLTVSTAIIEVDGAKKVLVCAQDVTNLKLTQLELLQHEESLRQSVHDLEASLAEKTVLIQEIHHRVKNNLAVISSLLGLKADTVDSVDAKAALEESQQRVHSMALIHEHLYGNDHLDRVNFSEYARQLIQGLYPSASGSRQRITIELDLDPIELGIERAVPCALILNELLSNAFKYAFPERGGTIAVRFGAPEPGSLELTVEDNGVGLPDGRLNSRQTKSLGLRIVRILTDQLDGSIAQEQCQGTRIVLRFPAERAAEFEDSPVSRVH